MGLNVMLCMIWYHLCNLKKHETKSLKASQMFAMMNIEFCCLGLSKFICFFYLDFLSRTFTIHRAAGEEGGYLFNSSLPIPPASQTLRHQPGDQCRELASAHSYQPNSNRKPLVSERKSLTRKLRPLKFICLTLVIFSKVLF